MEFTSAGFPSELHLVESFLSSQDALSGKDDLLDVATFRRWLRDHGRHVEPVTERDLDQAQRLRAALRSMAVAHHDREVVEKLTPLRQELEMIPVRLTVNDEGALEVRPAGSGVSGLFGELVVSVLEAEAADQWIRVKVCPVEDCQVAYYDRSKNQSRRWCSMAVCGNRAKTRTYYKRQTNSSTNASS